MHELISFLVFGTSTLGTFTGARLWVKWKLRGLTAGLKLGGRAPDFRDIPAADGKRYSRADLEGDMATVFVFMSNRCPGVKAYDLRLRHLEERFAPSGVVFVGINPVDPHLYPSESLQEMRQAAEERGIRFVYLQDETQGIARAFGAVCTPQVYVVDRRGRLRYRGRIDDSFLPERVSRRYLEDALDDLVGGREVRVAETQPLGCTIDWAPPEEGTGRRAAPRLHRSRAA